MRIGATIVLCFVAVTAVLGWQSGRSTLKGTVVDDSNGPMPGVTISLRGPDARDTTTDAKGQFAFNDVRVGDYEVRARLEGFPTTVEKVSVTETTKPIVIRMKAPSTSGIVFIDR